MKFVKVKISIASKGAEQLYSLGVPITEDNAGIWEKEINLNVDQICYIEEHQRGLSLRMSNGDQLFLQDKQALNGKLNG